SRPARSATDRPRHSHQRRATDAAGAFAAVPARPELPSKRASPALQHLGCAPAKRRSAVAGLSSEMILATGGPAGAAYGECAVPLRDGHRSSQNRRPSRRGIRHQSEHRAAGSAALASEREPLGGRGAGVVLAPDSEIGEQKNRRASRRRYVIPPPIDGADACSTG